jgi:16S rRNA processing protein RimM
MGEFLNAAQIVKARKRMGRLVVQPCDGLPFLLEEGMTVHIVPPSLDVPRTVVLDEAVEGEDCIVSFEGVDDYAQLVEYVGRYLLVARADIDEELIDEPMPDVEGFVVEDARYGALGKIVEILENPYQATLVVEGSPGEVMIPFVDEFIEDVDLDRGIVSTRVPDGLVEG